MAYTIADRIIHLSRPPPNELPLCDVDFRYLFLALDHTHILRVLSCIATEQKILFVASRWSLLVRVAEALCALLFPFFWQSM